MGRQTGDCLLATAVLAVALLLTMSQGKSDSHLRKPGESGNVSIRSAVSNRKTDSGRQQLPSVENLSRSAPRIVLKNLSRGTRIVVGSLDMSGHRHELSVTVGLDDSPQDAAFPLVRCDVNDNCRWEFSRRLQNPMCPRVEAQPVPSDMSLCSHVANETSSRVFLTPHFTDTGTVHEPAECRCVGESPRVRVYVDKRLVLAAAAEQVTAWSQSLTSAVELRALPVVDTWIGAISDVDHDQKLSIVVTDLEHGIRKASHGSRIYGCIRGADFRTDSDFCGDIIYVDPSIFNLPHKELVALLTHEATHAAVCSMQPDKSPESPEVPESGTQLARLQVSPWLSEAVAHFVEIQCCDSDAETASVEMSENFRRRIDDFFANPGGSPIVAAEDVLSLEERRSGSRGAATLFLAQWFASSGILKQFLRQEVLLDDRIEQIAGEPFADVFRDWTLSLATRSASPSAIFPEPKPLQIDRLPAATDHSRHSLIGTAFRCFECSDDIESLIIESDHDAQLQISVIEPDAQICSVKTE